MHAASGNASLNIWPIKANVEALQRGQRQNWTRFECIQLGDCSSQA